MRGPRKPSLKKKSISIKSPRKRVTTRRTSMVHAARRPRPKKAAKPRLGKEAMPMMEQEPMPGEDEMGGGDMTGG